MPTSETSVVEGSLFQGAVDGKNKFIFLPTDGLEQDGYFFSKMHEFCAWLHSFRKKKKIRLLFNNVPAGRMRLAGHKVSEPRRLTNDELIHYAKISREMQQ